MQWQEKLKKAGFSSLLELAVHAPVGYTDTRLSTTLRPGRVHTLNVTIRHLADRGGRLAAQAFLDDFNQPLEITLFHPKPWHRSVFRSGARLLLHGKLERFGHKFQMVNPQKLAKSDGIVPRYRCKLRQDLHRKLVASLVTEANLIGEGLREEEARLLVRMHRPDGEWLALYERHGGFGPKTLRALKLAEALDWFKRMGKKRTVHEAVARLNGSIEPFIKRLPFSLTQGQRKVIEEIAEDLAASTSARRMVVGDVGSGKTMVILASAMMAYPRRAVLMAPTSILARQLYEEARKWLPDEVKIALVSQNETIGKIEAAHLIVGTHALLYKPLPPAALVMVDEQHRFGTEQRAKLQALLSKGKKRPHYLQFSATPIPRTQAMIESALVDVSLIEGTPYKKDITTRVVGRGDWEALARHIEQEIAQERQVLAVYPLVESSEGYGYKSLEESEAFWRKRFKGVYVTHGKDKEKERVLAEFAQKGKILLTTTVIEVGISLPRLSTVIIVGAERMGLATLHQLRGRVSRTGLKGYCFLLTNQPQSERLAAFCRTTNGFEIARLDLKFRQSGDLLDGKVQSGQTFKWVDLAEDEEIVAEAKRMAAGRSPRAHSKGPDRQNKADQNQ